MEKVYCDLDTCLQANVIGYRQYCKLLETSNPEIRHTKDQLRGFGGGHIPSIGEIEIPCSHKSRKYIIKFQVVDVDHGTLQSEKTCLTLGLGKYCFKVEKNAGTDQVLSEA